MEKVAPKAKEEAEVSLEALDKEVYYGELVAMARLLEVEDFMAAALIRHGMTLEPLVVALALSIKVC